MTFGNLIDLGFALIAYLAATRRGRWMILFWILFPLHASTLFLEFRKSTVVLALLLPAFTAFLAHGDRKRLSAWLIATLMIYSAMTPIANYGRAEIVERGGNNVYSATFVERLEILHHALTRDRESIIKNRGGGEQASWLRLDYSGPMAFAMNSYDRSYTNPTIKDGLWRLVPRAVWPDKPTISGPGRDFYQLVSGTDRQARVGITYYADAYWNGGWPMVVVVSCLIGLFFAIASAYALRWIRTKNFVMFPAILLVADFALRGLNGWVQNGFALIPYLLAYALFIQTLRLFYIHKVKRNLAADRLSVEPHANPRP
ncbi:hypothetical protein DZC52_12250 [Wenzhouxiangella sediminis]|uniref:O-antigen polysaccharide polymerase Wzy n=2 Tax=Wenzhouxiangella sediminis TaxID=1792836 RepID=A0A3E1K6C5_9GAMM|nr:hypothetical protein DZC52_12250 [Wenzhouxiangella sediminis]